MSGTMSLSPEVVKSLNQLRQGSLMYALSYLLIYTGLIILILATPGAILIFSPNYYSSMREYGHRFQTMVLTYLVINFSLIVGGLILLMVSVLGLLVSGCDGLAHWNPTFRTGARLIHAIRTGILMVIAGFVFMVIGIFSSLALSILIIVIGIIALALAIIVMTIKDAIKQIHILSAVPEVFQIYLAIILILYGVLGVVFHEIPMAGLAGAYIILFIGFILIGLATIGIAIVFLQLGRVFKSTAMMLAGVLSFIPILDIVAFIIASMEIPEIISSSSSSSSL